jgi:hypothetical protein
MKRVLTFLGIVFLLLSASPYPENRITKEYYSIAVLAWDLDKGRVLNDPYYDVLKTKYEDKRIGTIFTPVPIMKKPYVDTIIHDPIYGEILITDETMRYVIMLSKYYQFEPIYILSLIQADKATRLTRKQLGETVAWAYRVRALGTAEKYILAEYKSLEKGFFEERK